MNRGIEILLERMKSNPEEFVPDYDGGSTKWNSLISRYHGFLTKEELEAFSNTQKIIVTEAMRERLTQEVMKEILDPKPDEGQERMRIGIGSTGIGVGTTLGAWGAGTATATFTKPSLTIGDTTISEYELKQMLATHNGTNK
jgi:hypothetical protein